MGGVDNDAVDNMKSVIDITSITHTDSRFYNFQQISSVIE